MCKLAVARAYAFAFYADADALATALGSPDAGVEPLDRLLQAKAAGGTGSLGMVLKMSRDIDGEHLAHGFENSVKKRLPQDCTQADVQAVYQLAAAFRRIPTLATGDTIKMIWRADGTLHVWFKQAEVCTLASKAAISALFEVYTGQSSVSARGRHTFAANTAEISQLQDTTHAVIQELVLREHENRDK